MSARASRFAWIGQRRGNRVGPLDHSDLAAFRVIGVILLAVAIGVTAYYGLDFDYAAYTTFWGEPRTARGTVVAVEPTDSYEPGVMRVGSKTARRDETTQIVAVHYTFVDASKVERQGTSYLPASRLKVGAAVTIEHPVGQLEVSRIRAIEPRSTTIYRSPCRSSAWLASCCWVSARSGGLAGGAAVAGPTTTDQSATRSPLGARPSRPLRSRLPVPALSDGTRRSSPLPSRSATTSDDVAKPGAARMAAIPGDGQNSSGGTATD